MHGATDLAAHAAALRAVTRALVHCAHDAEDVEQDAWVQILRAKWSGSLKSSVPWMKGVLRNVARSHQRRRRVHADLPSDPVSRTRSADETAIQSETSALLARAVHELPPQYREVVVRRFWNGETPRHMASDLGVPVQTVHNRLHRGLARLRATLGADDLGGAMLPALVVLGWPSTRRVASALALMNAPKVLTAAAAVLCAVLLVSTVELESPAPRDAADPGPAVAADLGVEPDVRLHATSDRGEDRVSAAAEGESRPAPVEPTDPAALAAAHPWTVDGGEVTLRVVDSRTARSLSDVAVRSVTEGRFLNARHQDPIVMSLAEGRYDMQLLKPRFDPLSLTGVEVRKGETTDLGTVELERGTASVGGVVWVPRARAVEGLVVELHGKGRNPCVTCEGRAESTDSPCVDCGFASDASRFAVQVGESFQFHDLAAGDYYALVYAGDGTVLFTRQFVLAPKESKWIELDLRFLDLKLTLIGEHGEPFRGEWVEEGERFTGPIQFFFLHDHVCCGAARWTPPEGATSPAPRSTPNPAAPSPPPPPPAEEAEEKENQARTFHLGATQWPSLLTPPPKVNTRPLAVLSRPRGAFEIHEVPASAETLVVSCGPYFTTRPLSLEDWDGRPIEVAMDQRCSSSSRSLAGQSTCQSCHQLPTAALLR